MARMHHPVEVAASVEQVWLQLQHAETWNGLSGIANITNVAGTETALSSFDFTATVAGTPRPGRAIVKRADVNQHLDLSIEQKDMALRIVMNLEASETGTNLLIGLEAEPKSFMVRLAWGAIIASVETGFPAEAESFGGRMEQAIKDKAPPPPPSPRPTQ